MDARELINQLADTSLVRDEVAMQMEFGLPWLFMQSGELCIRFMLHREDYDGSTIRCYAPQYKAAWVYPFAHAVLLQDLTYSDSVPNFSAPVAELNAQWMLSIGKAYLQEIYDACSRVLTFREKNGTVTDVVLHRYQELYRRTVTQLGLEALYS